MSQCALCHQPHPLKRSHIIPEFLYAVMYDEKHRFHVLSSVSDMRDSMAQKGIRERLLCGSCETLLSKYEGYARGVLSGGVPLSGRKNGNVVEVEGIDYLRFKLFQLSVLWRASVSKLPMFDRVSLGPHENAIRLMLLNGEPGLERAYPCIMFGLVDDQGHRADMIVQPGKLKLDGCTCYRLIFGGFLWLFFISKKAPDDPYGVAFLKLSGRLSFVIKNIFEASYIVNFAQARKKLGREVKSAL